METISCDAETLLIEAMVALHRHVIHAGTNFENRALAYFGIDPPTSIDDYRKTWNDLAERKGVTHGRND